MHNYTETDTLLSLNNISKSYSEKLVLKNVSASIKDIRIEGECKGQVVGFIGPSGIGKSTLFRIMAGLDKANSGEVLLANGKPVKAGDVGVVAQSYPLFEHRTVMSNLMLAASKGGLKHQEAHDKVIEYLNDFDLSNEASHYPAQLSGGQRQRCAILQQVIAGGHYLLMDEPFSGLDPLAKKKAQRLIQKVANLDETNTIIIVTHDIPAAVSVADHLWIMGRDRTTTGAVINGAFLVETYNLINEGLAWDNNIEENPLFAPFVTKINKKFEVL